MATSKKAIQKKQKRWKLVRREKTKIRQRAKLFPAMSKELTQAKSEIQKLTRKADAAEKNEP